MCQTQGPQAESNLPVHFIWPSHLSCSWGTPLVSAPTMSQQSAAERTELLRQVLCFSMQMRRGSTLTPPISAIGSRENRTPPRHPAPPCLCIPWSQQTVAADYQTLHFLLLRSAPSFFTTAAQGRCIAM